MSCVNTTNNKLYYNLVNMCDTEAQAKELYAKILNPDFIKDYKVKTDENGIPVFKDVYRKAKLNRHLKEERQIGYLESMLSPKTVTSSPENIDMLGTEVTIFNEQNEMKDFVAVIEKDGDTISSKIVRKTYNSDLLSKKIKTNTDLNNFLKQKLAEIGVQVGTITELERRRGIAGVTEFDRAKDAANGIVELIRISNDEKGAESLPEEFSHFALEAISDSNPLVSRLYNTISEELVEVTLGDQFEDYYEEYNGDINKLKKEVAGKLLAEYLKAEYTGQSANLISRVFNAIKSKFSQLDENDILKAAIELDATLTKASREILRTKLLNNVGLSNIQSSYNLYNLNEDKSEPPNDLDIGDVMDNMGLDDFDVNDIPDPNDLGIDIDTSGINDVDIDIPEFNEADIPDEILYGTPNYDDISAEDLDIPEFDDVDIDDAFNGIDIDIDNDIPISERGAKTNKIDIDRIKADFVKDSNDVVNELKTSLGKNELEKITGVFITIEASLGKLDKINKNKGYTDTNINNQEAIEKYLYKTKNMLGNVLYFVYNSIDNLSKAWDMYDSHSNSKDVNNRCNYLLVFSNTVKALDYMLKTTDTKNLRSVLSTEFSSESDKKIQGLIEKYLKELSFKIDDAMDFIQKEQISISKSYLSERFGDTFEIPMTLADGQTLTLDDELTGGKGENKRTDISFLTRWFSSMANSPSIILKMVDQIVKKSNDNRRNKMFETKRKIVALGREYVETTGSDDFSFMYAVDKDGKRTGYYTSEMDYAEYDKYYQEMVLSRKDEYIIDGEFVKENYIPIKKEFQKFMADNNYFRSEQYSNLNSKQKEFIEKFIKLKQSLDDKMFYESTVSEEDDDIIPGDMGIDFGNYLANKTKFNEEKRAAKTIKIEKSLINKLKSSKSIKEGIKELGRAIKETVIKTSSDNELIDDKNKSYLTNFDKERVYTIPALYTVMQEGESEENMTMDPISSLIAYGDAAENRYEKMQISSIIEILKEIVNRRELASTASGNVVLQKLKTHFGEFDIPVTVSGKDSNISKMLDDYLESQIYGMWNVDLGNFKGTNVSKSKLVNLTLSQTALTGMALNVLGGISNIETGRAMMRIESICGQFFDVKDVAKADIEYAKNIGKVIANAGELIKDNKLSVFIEQFNILQEYEQEIAHTEFDANKFARCCSEQGLFILNNLGEHYLQTRTALSVAFSNKVKDKDGKEISLWEAMEMRDIDDKHPEYGKKIFLKEGVTDSEGNEIKDVTEYFNKFARKVNAINQRMHGIYNYEDRCAAQRYAAGRLFIQFRKYIPVGIQRRFGSAQINFDLDSPTEGYYITAAKMVGKMYKELTQRRVSILNTWRSMNKWERQNCIRAGVEMGQTLLCWAAFNILESVMGDKQKKNPWAVKMMDYQFRRLYSELAAMTPSLGMLNESLKIIESPFAAIRILDKDIEFLSILNPNNWTEDAEIKQGKYKGHTKGAKAALQLLPVYSAMINTFDPYEATKFFKN